MTMTELNSEQVRALLAPLWEKNRGHVLRRLANVRRALDASADPDQSVRDDLHALAGTLGTYGWPEGSELAETILDALSGRNDLTRGELVRRLDALTATLP
ncbi:MAG TPA: Hpt domain-containing protein [Mycobacteriales bacterium]|jgi:HPt (histidine-containing phosphotransfer) domain-containing protein|nr:Hpt domain-containing protein [Mycobacteriales bacterium]